MVSILWKFLLIFLSSRNHKAERLTYDHKASDPAEQERIIGKGGFVVANKVASKYSNINGLC